MSGYQSALHHEEEPLSAPGSLSQTFHTPGQLLPAGSTPGAIPQRQPDPQSALAPPQGGAIALLTQLVQQSIAKQDETTRALAELRHAAQEQRQAAEDLRERQAAFEEHVRHEQQLLDERQKAMERRALTPSPLPPPAPTPAVARGG